MFLVILQLKQKYISNQIITYYIITSVGELRPVFIKQTYELQPMFIKLMYELWPHFIYHFISAYQCYPEDTTRMAESSPKDLFFYFLLLFT